METKLSGQGAFLVRPLLAVRVKGSLSALVIGLIAVGVVGPVEVGDERIDDQEGSLDVADEALEEGDVAGDDEGTTGLSAIGEGEQGHDASRIAPGGIDAGADGVDEIILGGEEDHGSGWGGLAAGERLSAGDAGGKLTEEGRFAEAGIAVEDSELAGGKAAGREPLDGVRIELIKANGMAQLAPDAVGHGLGGLLWCWRCHGILPCSDVFAGDFRTYVLFGEGEAEERWSCQVVMGQPGEWMMWRRALPESR
jgi:hypothetical protein